MPEKDWRVDWLKYFDLINTDEDTSSKEPLNFLLQTSLSKNILPGVRSWQFLVLYSFALPHVFLFFVLSFFYSLFQSTFHEFSFSFCLTVLLFLFFSFQFYFSIISISFFHHPFFSFCLSLSLYFFPSSLYLLLSFFFFCSPHLIRSFSLSRE